MVFHTGTEIYIYSFICAKIYSQSDIEEENIYKNTVLCLRKKRDTTKNGIEKDMSCDE